MNKIRSIQLLRGIAILAVLGFHAKENITPNGYLGVDVFFLISGYLIIPRIEDAISQEKLKEFYKRRFDRLAPALLFTLLAFLPIIFAFGSWKSHSDYAQQALWTLLVLGNIGAINISGNYFNPSSFLPLVHTWSLSVEEQIYFILPLGMAIFKKFLTACSVGSFALFIIQDFTTERTSAILFYLAISRFWEFHLGYLVFRMMRKKSRPLIVKQYWKFALVLILFVPIETPRIPTTILVLFLSSIVMISRNESGSIYRILHVVGDRSYSIYLLHMPILYIAKFSPVINSTNRMKESLLAIPLTFLLAEFSFRKIEFCLVKSK